MFTQIKEALLHLAYPHICAGCGTDTLPSDSQLCVKCIHALPYSGFEKQPNNPIEKILSGRVPFNTATAQLYFTQHSILQNMMHQFKYRANKELGHQLGLIAGNQLLKSNRFKHIAALVPIPLHQSKQRKRGYNQAEILCNGMAEVLNVPVVTDAVVRTEATESQTKKNRVNRWLNMDGKFMLDNTSKIAHKQILLVDDVITTGATIEACANALLNAKGVEINVATLCYASNI